MEVVSRFLKTPILSDLSRRMNHALNSLNWAFLKKSKVSG